MSESSKLRSTVILRNESDPQLSEAQQWADYFKYAQQVMAGNAPRIQVQDDGETDAPTVLVMSEHGTADISALLQPGSQVIRKRPEGDVPYVIPEGIIQASVGSRKGEWRLPLEATDGSRLAVDLRDLTATPNPQNGRSWRLDIQAAVDSLTTSPE